MFDILFLILISIFVPIIVFAGFKIFKCTNLKKFLTVLTLIFLACELIRFFCNAALYSKAETPRADVKFGIVTLLCIISLFATFNKSKFAGGGLRDIFILTAFSPIVIGLFNPNSYINALDVNGVCKALYMIECGIVLTIALLYVFENNIKINAMNILWACIFVLIFVGINALTILYWKINTPFDLLWYLSWLTVLLSIPIVFTANRLYHLIKDKNNNKEKVPAEDI